jgi:hypothetical protein
MAALLAVIVTAGLAGPAAGVHDATLPFQFRFAPCRDEDVARFVGQPSTRVLAEVKSMNLRTHRLLHRHSPVNFEVVPERLTLVVDERAVVVRAFCR